MIYCIYMPYQNDTKKLKLNKKQDRRYCSLTDKDRGKIRSLYYENEWAVRKIARKYAHKCSRRLVIFIIHPERLKALQEQNRKEKHHLKYYDKDKWREYMRSHRKHRAEVFKAKKAAPNWSNSEYRIAYSELGPETRIRTGRTLRAIYSKRYREKLKLQKI